MPCGLPGDRSLQVVRVVSADDVLRHAAAAIEGSSAGEATR